MPAIDKMTERSERRMRSLMLKDRLMANRQPKRVGIAPDLYGITLVFHRVRLDRFLDGLVYGFEGFGKIRGGQTSDFNEFDHDLFAGPQDLFFNVSLFHQKRPSFSRIEPNNIKWGLYAIFYIR
jgi:hypothetical protein